MVEDEQYNLWTSLMDLSFSSGGDVLIDSWGLKVKQEAASFWPCVSKGQIGQLTPTSTQLHL